MDIEKLHELIFDAGKLIVDDTLTLDYISSLFQWGEKPEEPLYPSSILHGEEYYQTVFNPLNARESEFIYHFLENLLVKLEEKYDEADAQILSNMVTDPSISFYPLGKNPIFKRTQDLRDKIHIFDDLKWIVIEWFQSNGLEPPKKLQLSGWEMALQGFSKKVYALKEEYFRDKNYKQDSSHLNKDVTIIEDKEIKEDLNRTFWALADDMRERKKNGEFETYKQAYQYAERHYTIKGKTVTVKQLESNYYKAKSSGYVD